MNKKSMDKYTVWIDCIALDETLFDKITNLHVDSCSYQSSDSLSSFILVISSSKAPLAPK